MKKSVISVCVIVVVIALLLYTAFFGLDLGFTEISSVQEGVVPGLDLVGGSEITYEAIIPEGTSSSEIKSGMDSAVAMLRQRLDDLGYSEASVYKSGETRVVIEIPNVSDPEAAVQMLGTTAVVEFRDADGTVWLEGGDIKSATAKYSAVDSSGVAKNHVELQFTAEGQAKFAEATKAVANRSGDDNYIAIVMDDQVISTPYVDKTKYKDTGINSDTAIITMGSDATTESVSYLANIINAGKLPFSLENVKLQAVGATLGEQALNTSLKAGLIGVILVMLFMIAFYRLPGLVADIALLMYGGLFALILSITGTNLTLPGIAGIVLTIGMAVDANVIIYERIKEELRAGKTLRASIDAGYNRAFSSIVDSNVTTAIAAVVLWWQGTGTIVGFAKTLLIGVVLSMVIMLIVTRILLKCAVDFKITNIKAYGA